MPKLETYDRTVAQLFEPNKTRFLLRAFYTEYEKKEDKASIKAREQIAPCLWKTDEIDETPDMDSCKLETEVATDEAKGDFETILKAGTIPEDQKSRYAVNYRFFQTKIDEFLKKFDGCLPHFSTRILKNCILLEIIANSSDSAMRIFSTLNDRGKPLSDADIFKAQLYNHYNQSGRKDDFIRRWKELEKLCSEVYHPLTGTPMDEAFTRYVYYARAKQGIKSSTRESLRKFYEKESYALLKDDETFENIIDLANFWQDVSRQNAEKFSERVLKRLFVLNYAPNDMWANIVSVYYLTNRDSDGMLDDEKFYRFLDKITAFIWAFSFSGDRNDLRTPIYAAMIDIVGGRECLAENKFELDKLLNNINNYAFTNRSAMTRPMATWWAFNDEAQPLLDLDKVFQIEHIYAKKRYEFENSLSNERNIETLGNKSLLEKRINIRAADYRFAEKIKYYKGYTNSRNEWKDGTQIKDLRNLADNLTDFTENEIVQRNALIIQKFIEYLKKNDLIK